ncbi:MAG: hypothetical protein FJ034_05185 [Chloroflexi bacterium]|nr:hypothetical protein [Chloroflexota bacterium]
MTLARALKKHRADLVDAGALRTADDLVRLVDRLGFAFAFSRDAAYPVPVADEKSWKNTWHWKDELAEAKRLYYGKILVSKPTFVSMKMLPVFFATHGRAGEPDDHLEDVRAGRIGELGHRIVEYLTQHGETQTRRLRKELGIVSDEGRRQYGKAIDVLQRLMYVTVVRAVGDGRDDYNYTWDVFARRYPEALRAAEKLSSFQACAALLERTVALAGGVTERQVARLFEWGAERVSRTASHLEGQRKLARGEGGMLLLPALARA